MKVTREQAERHHQTIVTTAAKLFREKGIDGVSVAEVMAAAGLTHGGFYGHFGSKAALSVASTTAALAETQKRWSRRAAARPGDPLGGIVDGYLTPSHRDRAGSGCPIAALATEVSRSGPDLRRAFTDGIGPVIDTVAAAVPPEAPDRRAEALGAIATLVGTLILARAVDDPDLSDAFLAAGRTLLGR